MDHLLKRLLSSAGSAGVLAVALVLSGCGGSSGEASAPAATASSQDVSSPSAPSAPSPAQSSQASTGATEGSSALAAACTVLRDEIQTLYDGYDDPGATADDETAQYQAISDKLRSSLSSLDGSDKKTLQAVVDAAGARGAVGPEPADANEGLDWALANLELVIEFGRTTEEAKKVCSGEGIDLPDE